jgi:predicted acetyltransferase
MSSGEILVPISGKDALREWLADYVIEMTAIIGLPPSDGRYPYFDLYWTEPDSRWPYWLMEDRTNAGFALIRRNHEAGRTEMAEFYVAPKFRHRGIGLGAARRLIKRYPGDWRITQRKANSGAIAFWHRVLDGFVAYREIITETDAVRSEQFFSVV